MVPETGRLTPAETTLGLFDHILHFIRCFAHTWYSVHTCRINQSCNAMQWVPVTGMTGFHPTQEETEQ